MDNAQAKQALLDGKPVVYHQYMDGDVEYARITAIIYRKAAESRDILVSLELMDKHENSVTVVKAQMVDIL